MIILEFIARVFVEILFEGIILGFFKFIGKLFKGSRHSKVEKNKNKVLIKTLEKKFLYKEIELIENLNSTLKYGMKGTVLEIIDEDKVFAEFYDRKGNQVEWNDNLVFEIGFNQIKLRK